MAKKPLDIPFHVLDNVQDPPVKPGGHRRLLDLDPLSVIPDDAEILIQYNQKTYRTTKSEFIGSLGKIYLTEGPLLSPAVDGVIEYSGGHLYFTDGDRFVFVGSVDIKTDTTTAVNTVVETTIYSHLFQANALHADQRVLVSLTGVLDAATASETVTIRYKFGGVAIHSVVITPTNGTDIAWRAVHEGTIRTAGASGTYIDFSEFSESGVVPVFGGELVPHAIDSTVDTLYEVTAEWGAAKAGNSFSCTQGDITYKH